MKRLSLIGMIIVAVGILIFIGTTVNSQASSPSTSIPLGIVPNHGPQRAGHLPAIHPQSALVAAKSAPTFTSTDVEKYLLTDALAQDVTTQKFTHTITFVSAQDLGQKLGADFSQDSSILCYVEFTGKAPVEINEVRRPPQTKSPLFTKAFEVFDGQTGDLIVWGAKP